jgi:hypothetical protein
MREEFMVGILTVSWSMRSKNSYHCGAEELDMKERTFLWNMSCMLKDSGSEVGVGVDCRLLSDMMRILEND